MFLEYCDEIGAICQDFFEATGLTYYNFVRVYNNKTRISLNTNRPWQQFVFESIDEFKSNFVIMEDLPNKTRQHIVIWDNADFIRNNKIFRIARENFDIDHGATIINPFKDFIEYHLFATNRENDNINQFYLNNLDLLHNFIFYFKDKAANIINRADSNRETLSSNDFLWLEWLKRYNANKKPLYYKKLNQQTTRYYVGEGHKRIYLTRREAQCVSALIDGISPKELARHFGISYRTVQAHIDNARHKLCCNNRSDLLKLLSQSSLTHVYRELA